MQFFQGGGGGNLVYGQRGGAEAYVRCYTLRLLGGGVNLPPPLIYSPAAPAWSLEGDKIVANHTTVEEFPWKGMRFTHHHTTIPPQQSVEVVWFATILIIIMVDFRVDNKPSCKALYT